MRNCGRTRIVATIATVVVLLCRGAAQAAPETRLITAHDAGLTGFVSPAGLGGTSGDGRYTVFVSNSPTAAPGVTDANNTQDVFLYDNVGSTTTLVSHKAGALTTSANAQSINPSISADGNWVVFESFANDLVSPVSDANSSQDIFLWSRASGAIVLVSGRNASAPRRAGSGYSVTPSISSDGAYVAFQSSASDLVPGVTGLVNVGVFVYDRAANTLVLANRSAASATVASNQSAYLPVISGNGQFVGYQSQATNLVTGQVDGAGSNDAFLYDRLAGTNVLISHTTAGLATAANATSQVTGLSNDGAWVVFTSTASAASMVGGASDPNGSASDVFLFQTAGGGVTLVSHAASSGTTTSNGSSTAPSISGDGSRLAYESTGTDLLSGETDANLNRDLFTADRATLTTTLVSHQNTVATTAANGFAGYASIAADGSLIAYLSNATNLVSGQAGTGDQVFAYAVGSGTNAVVSHASAAVAQSGNANAGSVLRVSGDGSAVVFQSAATDLIGGPPQPGGASVVFQWKLAGGAVTRLKGPNVEPLSGFEDASTAVVSRDGRYVALISAATDLLPGGGNSAPQVYLWDVTTHAMKLVSHAVASTFPGNGACDGVSISADGRYVAFSSQALNVGSLGQTGDVAGSDDVFLWDRLTDVNTLVSHNAAAPGAVANGPSNFPSISADGTKVAFVTAASTLQAGIVDGNGTTDVYVWDRATNASTLVSAAAGSATTTANGFSYAPNISDNGGRVEFASTSSNLVSGQVDANGVADIFVYTLAGGQRALVSHADGAPATAADLGVTNLVTTAVLSGDGSTIAFESPAKNLVTPNVSGNLRNIYRFVVATGVNTLVSHQAGAPTVEADGISLTPLISSDGKSIAFDSLADDLMAGASDLNAAEDVFVWNAVADTTTLLSHAAGAASTAADNTSLPLAISADGKFVLFASFASDLMTGLVDANRGSDLYVSEVVSNRVALVTHTAAATTAAANRPSYGGSISGDGQRLAFVSDASDLVAGDYNDYRDAFLSSLGQDFFSLPPCRVLDTRSSSALSNGVPRLVAMAGVCGIPADARAVSINLTVTLPTMGGNLVAYPANLPAPLTNNLSFGSGQTRANNGILLLDTTGGGQAAFLAQLLGPGTAHIVIDVNGYFR